MESELAKKIISLTKQADKLVQSILKDVEAMKALAEDLKKLGEHKQKQE